MDSQLDTPHDPDSDADTEAKESEAEANAEIVAQAKDRYRVGIDTSTEWREAALKDLQFLAGDQWDSNIKGQRDAQGRPALTVNRLPQFVRQVTNEQRQSKPSVTVNPVDDGSDIRTAEVLQGCIRNVEYTSNADAAYASGGQSAAITGLGYWDVRAEYEDEKSFEQKLSIVRIPNPMSVALDPGTKEMAGDDARWAVISTDISEGEWKSRWPHLEIPKGSSWEGNGDSAASWVAKDGVRIHEYRYIKDEPDTLWELPAGIFEDKPEGGAALESELLPGLVVALKQAGANSRPTTRRKACWAKIAGDEVIEKGEFAGRYLQLVRVVGTELEIDGKTIYEGVIRHAQDTQRMLNYFVTAEAEAIALTPKAPFIGTPKQFEGFEEIWETANQRPTSYLPYNPDPQAPPPQRVMAEANVSAITNARMQAADDLKAVTGIYDAALGARSNEQSGRAILARQSQGQTANFHFQDNLAMAIRYTGRILVDLIPRIYSGARVLRILGEDGAAPQMVPVNGHPGKMPDKFATSQEPISLNAGRYDVAVSMGPSYVSRRQEAAAQLLELIRVNPSISQIAGDLLVESMDIPGGKAIAERIRKTLPPEIRPADDKQPPPQVLAQQLAQSQQMIQQMTEQLHSLSEQIETKAQDNEAKERIEMSKLHVSVLLKLAELESTQSVALLKAEAAHIGKRLALTGFNEPIEGEQLQGGM
jgi:hypothetical protein